MFRLWGTGYSKIGFKKYARSAKILPKKCPKSAFQTKPANPIADAFLVAVVDDVVVVDVVCIF